MEDGRRGGADEDTLIDAKKPEWGEEADGRGVRGEERLERSGDGRMEEKNGEQEHDGHALKQRRNTSKDVLPDGVEQDALEREEGGGRKHPTCKDSGGVREQMG